MRPEGFTCQANDANEWRAATRANSIHVDIGDVEISAELQATNEKLQSEKDRACERKRAYDVADGGCLTIFTCMTATRPSMAFEPFTLTVR